MSPRPGSTPSLGPLLGAGLPDLALGGAFLLAWLRPAFFPEDAVGYFVLLMLLEFIVIHSAAVMGSCALGDGPVRKRVLAMLGLAAFYSLFVMGFAAGFKSWWPVTSFVILIANRISGMLLDPNPDGARRDYIKQSWAVSVMAYLAFCFATILLPVPRLGLTHETLARAPLPGGGLWIDEPWRALAFGFLYFTAVGLSELVGHRWLRTPAGARTAG